MMTRRQPHCRTCTWMVSFSTLTDVFLSVVFFQNSAESGSYVTMHGHHCARVRKAACERAGGERGSPPERSGLLQQVARQVRWSLRRIPSACPTPGRPRGSPQVARPCAPSRAAPAFGSSSARLRVKSPAACGTAASPGFCSFAPVEQFASPIPITPPPTHRFSAISPAHPPRPPARGARCPPPTCLV
jgi:hypothetical protein